MPARGGLWLGFYLGPTTFLGPPVPLGRAVETSSATALRRAKVRRLGQPAVGSGYGDGGYGTTLYGAPLMPATEAELATLVRRRKLRRFGQPVETSSARKVTPVKRRRIGPGREKQRARPMTRRHVLEPVVEHDTARPIRPVKARRIGPAVELSTVCSFVTAGGYGEGGYGTTPYPGPQAGSRRKRRRIGPGKDRQRARPITPT